MPKWTELIHDEWIRNVLKNRADLSFEKLDRTRQLMNLHAEGSIVEGYHRWIPNLSLPDENDRHVLAAAIEASASVIVTFNLADFPKHAVVEYEIEVQHPDDFLCSLIADEPDVFVGSLQEMLAQLTNPPRSLGQHIEVLRNQGLPKLAERLQEVSNC